MPQRPFEDTAIPSVKADGPGSTWALALALRSTSNLASIGMTVSATTSEARMAQESVTANGRNNCPAGPLIRPIGAKTLPSSGWTT